MSNASDPALFADLPAEAEVLRGQRPTLRKRVDRNEIQLKMFAETTGDIRDGSDLDLKPLDATFRDSSEAPLHSWFPYIEGYSPAFVERVRHEYLGEPVSREAGWHSATTIVSAPPDLITVPASDPVA